MKARRVVAALGILAAVVVQAWVAQAQSLKIRQLMAAYTRDVAQDAEHTSRSCDTNLSVTFDWADAPFNDLLKYSASGYCGSALEAIRRVCGDRIGKDAVKTRIKTVSCGFAASRTIDLKNDGTLDYKIHFDSVNDADFVFEYLQNNL
jgi:hypothetical protein